MKVEYKCLKKKKEKKKIDKEEERRREREVTGTEKFGRKDDDWNNT